MHILKASVRLVVVVSIIAVVVPFAVAAIAMSARCAQHEVPHASLDDY